MAIDKKAQVLQHALLQAKHALETGRVADALRHCSDALKADRDNFDALYMKGMALLSEGAYSDARVVLRRAVQLRANSASAHRALGTAYGFSKQFDEAVVCYRRSIALDPDRPETHHCLSLALQALQRSKEAYASARMAASKEKAALSRAPGEFLGRIRLGMRFEQLGDLDAARDCAREALSIKPDWPRARGHYTMYQLPSIFEDAATIAQARLAFEHDLANLRGCVEAAPPGDAYQAFEMSRVFYLAYQEESNLALLSNYGDLCARTLRRWYDNQHFEPVRDKPHEKIRIGLVASNFAGDSVWNAIVRGWVEHIDRSSFELHLLQLEASDDARTREIAARMHHTDLTVKDLCDVVPEIRRLDFDILLYPEIGMNRKVALLAAIRLAPIQVASWGHPETTGLPTMDYFLSAEAFEPPGAQEHYREQLVLLPQLGCCAYPSDVSPATVDLNSLGISDNQPLIICPGTPFKYAPQFDFILVEIARRLGRCQLVFFEFQRHIYTEKLQRRLQRAFHQHGVEFEKHVVFVPWLDRARFIGLLARADVYLDTIGFSGFNTALQAVEATLPIVTREGRFMRGRFASGVLRAMGLDELVATSEDAYVEQAVRLASDAPYRDRLRERIAAARSRLFGNVDAIRALEQFCVRVSRHHESERRPE